MTPSPAFPDTSRALRSKDGSEPILGASIALNRILLALKDQSDLRRLWAINLRTLLENVWIEGMDGKTAEAAVEREIDHLILYIEAHAHAGRKISRNPVILFYVPTYDRIPRARRQIFTGSTKFEIRQRQMDRVWDRFRARLFTARPLRLARPQDHADSWYATLGKGQLPHRDIARFFSKEPQTDPVHLISHTLIDCHLFRHRREVRLVERFTGKILKQKDLAKKIDPGLRLDFNAITHQVMGDRFHLKPLVTPQERRAILKAAKEEDYRAKTETEILTRLRRHATLPASALSIPL